jgi:tetraacyldisaccharide 4'-kinase
MRAPGFWWREPGPLSALLTPLSAIYGAIARSRLERAGAKAGIPVICVGNPTVGGAGKTPAAIAIAQLLLAAGEHATFLSRGYGGRLAGPVTVDPAVHHADDVGDEPLLLARLAPTVVSRDRVAGARHAQQRGATVIVMDDGFQNPALAKDLSILVVDARRGIGNGQVLPAGPLRAPITPQLERAMALLIVGDGPGADLIAGAAAAARLPVFHGRLEPDRDAIAGLLGKKLLAFAGIGDPEKFFATLAAAGLDAVVRRSFGDHHRYSRTEADQLIAEAERDQLTLVTTEKDVARMRGDMALSALAARAKAFPVKLAISQYEEFRRLVCGAALRIKPASGGPGGGAS